jgi:hypothetical protein
MVAGAEIARSSICFEVRFLPRAFGAAGSSGQSMPLWELHITIAQSWRGKCWLFIPVFMAVKVHSKELKRPSFGPEG